MFLLEHWRTSKKWVQSVQCCSHYTTNICQRQCCFDGNCNRWNYHFCSRKKSFYFILYFNSTYDLWFYINIFTFDRFGTSAVLNICVHFILCRPILLLSSRRSLSRQHFLQSCQAPNQRKRWKRLLTLSWLNSFQSSALTISSRCSPLLLVHPIRTLSPLR